MIVIIFPDIVLVYMT